MRKWIVVLLVSVALISVSAQGLASNDNPATDELSDALEAVGDVLPFNGDDDDDDDNSGPGNGDDDEDEDDDEEDDDQDDEDDEDDEDEDDEEDDEDEDDEDEDELEDEDDEEEREVKVEIEDEDQEVTIKLESKTQERKDEVKVNFQAIEGQMKVSFEREAMDEEEVEMRVTFHRVIEFNDTSGDGAFDPLDDEIVQQFLIEGLAVENLTAAAFEADGKQGQRVTVNYTFPGTEDGRFILVFWVFGQFAFVNGVPVRPSEAKIDIHIENFPFREEQSAIAVDLVVKTEFEFEMQEVTLDELIAQGEEFAAFFRWSSEATVDDVTRQVNSTILREEIEAEVEGGEGEFEKKTRLFLAYPRGSEIVHDPTVGIMAISTILTEGFSFMAFTIGLGTAVLLVLGVWAFNRQRR